MTKTELLKVVNFKIARAAALMAEPHIFIEKTSTVSTACPKCREATCVCLLPHGPLSPELAARYERAPLLRGTGPANAQQALVAKAAPDPMEAQCAAAPADILERETAMKARREYDVDYYLRRITGTLTTRHW